MAWKVIYSELQTTHIIVHRGLFVYDRARSSLARNSHFAVKEYVLVGRSVWYEFIALAVL